MEKEIIKTLIKSRILRPRKTDFDKIKSLINSAESNSAFVKSLPLNEKSATVIFRELYESIRQLGDARWWLMGYEPMNHEVSLDFLKELEVEQRYKLDVLNRFKSIRHLANYKGFKVSVYQAREIKDFWNNYGGQIIKKLKNIINAKLDEG